MKSSTPRSPPDDRCKGMDTNADRACVNMSREMNCPQVLTPGVTQVDIPGETGAIPDVIWAYNTNDRIVSSEEDTHTARSRPVSAA